MIHYLGAQIFSLLCRLVCRRSAVRCLEVQMWRRYPSCLCSRYSGPTAWKYSEGRSATWEPGRNHRLGPGTTNRPFRHDGQPVVQLWRILSSFGIWPLPHMDWFPNNCCESSWVLRNCVGCAKPQFLQRTLLSLSLPRATNFKFRLQPHQKCSIHSTRLFIAHSDERLLYYQFSLPPLSDWAFWFRLTDSDFWCACFLSLGVEG